MNLKKCFRQLISLLLTFVMLFSIMPSHYSVAAAEANELNENDIAIVTTVDELIDAIDSGVVTMKLDADITYDANTLGRMIVDKSITLDFNGNILYSVGGTFQQSSNNWNDAIFDIAETGSLTLVNAQIQTGTFNIIPKMKVI